MQNPTNIIDESNQIFDNRNEGRVDEATKQIEESLKRIKVS